MGMGHPHHGRKWDRLARYIRRARYSDERNRARFQRGHQPVEGFFDSPGGGYAVIVAALPGEQVGVMFDVQIDDLAPLGTALARRFSESVVLRVKITTSSALAPRNRCNVARADS